MGYYIAIAAMGGGYLKNFLGFRVLPLFIINCFLVTIYSLEKFFLFREFDFGNILLSLIYGGNIVNAGWYLQVIIIFYFIFYFGMRFFDKHIVGFCSGSILIYMAIACLTKMHIWYWVSSLAFPVGMIFAEHKEKCDFFVRRHYTLSIIVAILLFAALFFLLSIREPENYNINIISRIASLFYGLSFVALMLLVSMQTPPASSLSRCLSTIYLEIYVMQGFIMNMLRNDYWSVNNPWLFSVFSIIGTIILARIIHPVFRMIITYAKENKNSNTLVEK